MLDIYGWGTRSFVEDFRLHFTHDNTICVAEYPPLQLRYEGANEREARDGLLTLIWCNVARLMEAQCKRGVSIKNTMDNIVTEWFENNPVTPIVKIEKMGVVEIMVEFPEEVHAEN